MGRSLGSVPGSVLKSARGARRYPKVAGVRARGIVVLLAAAYFALVSWLLMFAEPRVLRRLAVRSSATLADGGVSATPGQLSLAIALALFVPVGVFLYLLVTKPVAVVLLGTWLVVMVEAAQVGLLDRQGKVVDVIAGVAGVLLGAALTSWAQSSREA